MLLGEIPQWARQSFVRSLQAVGATSEKDDLLGVCQFVLECWCAPERKHHNIHHVMETLAAVEELAPETHSPDNVRLATWFHGIVFSVSRDAIYSHNGGEDELASATQAADLLIGVGVPEETADTIASLIKGMRDRRSGLHTSTQDTAVFDAIDIDQLAVRDAHLSTLATDPQDYRKYTKDLRDEYASVPDVSYFASRMRVIQRLLNRKRLFLSPLAQKWEESAQQNLTAELERIEAWLEEHQPADSHKADGGEPDQEQFHNLADVKEPPESADDVLDINVEARRDEDEAAVRQAESSRGTGEPFKSTLHEPDESFEPGAPPRILDAEEQEIARREKISEDALKLIDSRTEDAQENRAHNGDEPMSGLEKGPEPHR